MIVKSALLTENRGPFLEHKIGSKDFPLSILNRVYLTR